MTDRIFIIIPVYNRAKITLKCLNRLSELGVYDWASVVLVDDGSTDHTVRLIEQTFPTVKILQGDGSLWWTGGIKLGMEYAFEKGVDFFFWLNDDCFVREGVLEKLLCRSKQENCITLAQAITPTGKLYGGHRKSMAGIKAVQCSETKEVVCDVINGNCVCIPRSVVETIGFPDAKYLPQNRGDSDYSLRAAKKGFHSVVIGSAICENEDNLSRSQQSWLLGDRPLLEVWKSFGDKKSSQEYKSSFVFYTRHWGAMGLFLFLQPYFKMAAISVLRLCFSKPFLVHFFGKKSEAWKKFAHYSNDK